MNREEAVGFGNICQVAEVQYGGILNGVDEKRCQETTYRKLQRLCLQ